MGADTDDFSFASPVISLAGMSDEPSPPPVSKGRKSDLLQELLADLREEQAEERRRSAPLFKRLREIGRAWPNGRMPPLFCWLWNNHAEVVKLRREYCWEGIAYLATEDGIKGRWGAPPTASSIRRVWQRVCREKVEREERARAWAEEKRGRRGR